MRFHKLDEVVILLAISGLLTFVKNLIGIVRFLYQFALTPSGAAVILVATLLLSCASLAVSLIRRS